METALRGHSPFKVELVNGVVRKSASSLEDFERLSRQLRRQLHMDEIYDRFKTALPLKIDKDSMSVEMEFIPYPSPIFCAHTHMEQILNHLKGYFCYKNNVCKRTPLDQNAFVDKVRSTYKNIQKFPNRTKVEIDALEAVVPRFIGTIYDRELIDNIDPCHGDLTLTNMMYDAKEDEIYCIDLLDSWNHSVYADLAKLNQEVTYEWSLISLNSELSVEQGRAYGVLLRRIRDEIILSYDRKPKTVIAYSILNDLRLLQYEKRPEFRLRIIKSICEDARIWF